ncbi:MAG: class I SAM-dependent methyltransferase [Burkholderiaceae bacterium]|nr:class I SAM-dependent methyltransferase [Burkholderiaceae bacterium]
MNTESGQNSPHPPLTDYYESAAAREDWVRGIFDRTAIDYDRIEAAMAFGTGPWYRRQALLRAGLAPGMRVLDVGTGTGLVAREAARIVGDAKLVTGVDPSPGMLSASKMPEGMQVRIGKAEALPAEDADYDFLSMGFALRHVPDLVPVFDEYLRVLKPGGRLCILEITRPESRVGLAALKAYMRLAVPLIARAIGRSAEMPELMRYYWDTIEACVPPARVLERLSDAGFTQVDRHVELGIFSEYRAVRAAGPAPRDTREPDADATGA